MERVKTSKDVFPLWKPTFVAAIWLLLLLLPLLFVFLFFASFASSLERGEHDEKKRKKVSPVFLTHTVKGTSIDRRMQKVLKRSEEIHLLYFVFGYKDLNLKFVHGTKREAQPQFIR